VAAELHRIIHRTKDVMSGVRRSSLKTICDLDVNVPKMGTPRPRGVLPSRP
jgi:hypothetical protein